MFGFPVNLQDSGVQKFTNDADNGFPKIQQREVFYSVKDGDWLDSTIWQTASGRVGMIPGANDDVYIKNVVKIQSLHPVFGGSYFCNNLFVSGTFNFYNFVLNIYGNFKNVGIVNSGLGTGFFSEIRLHGVENVLGIINQNNWTNIKYARNGTQYIQPFNYYRLSTSGLGTKYLTSNTIVLENLICDDSSPSAYIGGIVNSSDDKLPIFECAGYELEVYGQTLIKQWSIFKQSGSGRLIFRGFLGVGFGLQYAGGFLLPGNPNVECQNGLFVSYDINLGYGTRGGFYSGLGTWRFTTNNQNIWTNVGSSIYLSFDAPITIAPGITLSHHNQSSPGNTIMYLNNTINGESSISKFENRGNVVFQTAASVASMTTGLFDFTTYTNTITYGGNYTATIPSYFTTFHNLTISGTGTKSLGVNTTINNNLTIGTGSVVGQLQLGNFDLFVGGITNLEIPSFTTSQSALLKSGPGNITFVGKLQTFSLNTYTIDFSVGNPNVELRGGIQTYRQNNVSSWKTGTGTWTFTTNNQSITDPAGGPQTFYDCPIVISSGITLTIDTGSQIFLNNTINGASATSTLIVKSTLNFNSLTSLSSMSVGTFDFLTNSTSTIGYTLTNNCTLPFTTYNNLNIFNGGIKTASGNMLIQGNFQIGSSSPTLEMGSFNLQINGTSTHSGWIKKSGPGNVLFIGLVKNDSLNTGFIDFSGGNPNVEVRGGINMYRAGSLNFKSGTGTWTFSTNNQSIIDTANDGTESFDGPVLIDGAITLTIGQVGNSGIKINFNQGINGNNANSKLLIGPYTTNPVQITHNFATQPMATGILDTSTNLNTWIYGSGNQDIKGGPTTLAKQVYRNLTLNGGGTKTLQGYVSVQNTYTLTSPATLNNNGFTLTNP